MTLSAPAILLTAAASLLAILVLMSMGILVGRVRGKVGIMPPAMTGAPELDRAIRVQGNTLEQFVIFLPALWLAALYFQGWVPPILGLVWSVGRIIYAAQYLAGRNRAIGFGLTLLPSAILVVLAAIGIAQAW